MSIRTERVARLVQREIASLLLTDFSNEIPGMITVTNTRVTRDLSIAYVYVSVMGADAEKKAIFEHLSSFASRIRGALGGRIRHQVRKIPEVRFFLDDSFDRAAEIEQLFDEIKSNDEALAGKNGDQQAESAEKKPTD